MRSSRELILVTFVMAVGVTGLHRWRTRRPSRIRGIVVDISTGHPVAAVRVCPKFLNRHGEAVLTDNRGRFTMPVSAPGIIWGMFVDDPHYAGLLGNVVGREDHAFLDEGSHPIPGCEIELFRPGSLQVLYNQGTHRIGGRV